MPILSVFAPLLKSRFFVIYFRGVTLADKRQSLPCVKGGGFAARRRRRDCWATEFDTPSVLNQLFCQLPPREAFVAIRSDPWYNTPNESITQEIATSLRSSQ